MSHPLLIVAETAREEAAMNARPLIEPSDQREADWASAQAGRNRPAQLEAQAGFLKRSAGRLREEAGRQVEAVLCGAARAETLPWPVENALRPALDTGGDLVDGSPGARRVICQGVVITDLFQGVGQHPVRLESDRPWVRTPRFEGAPDLFELLGDGPPDPCLSSRRCW